jgi:hypothetical protein
MLVGSSVTVDERHRDPFIQKSIDPIIQYLSVKYLCNTHDFMYAAELAGFD